MFFYQSRRQRRLPVLRPLPGLEQELGRVGQREPDPQDEPREHRQEAQAPHGAQRFGQGGQEEGGGGKDKGEGAGSGGEARG